MSNCTYTSINASSEIRLLTLLPGSFNDHIHLQLFSAPFIVSHDSLDTAEDEADVNKRIQETLTDPWIVRRTLEGDVIFCYNDTTQSVIPTRWDHPISTDKQPTLIEQSRHEPGSSLPKYEALSYTWGSMDNSITAYVQPHNQELPVIDSQSLKLQIGNNLANALRYLRYTDRIRTLWVNAICINQHDKAERNEQVRRMGEIYKHSDRVVVWLGEESINSRVAISTLAFLGSQVELTKDYRRMASPGCPERFWHLTTHTLPYDTGTWDALFDLLGRPWFSRLWILQEIQLSNRNSVMQCGRDMIEWRLFRRAISCLNDKKQGPSQEMRDRLGPINSMCWVRRTESLAALLNMARGRKCSENHDKVYAILGLFPPEVVSRINPDYDLPFESVFRDMLLIYIDTFHRIDLIQRCNNLENRQGLASWVPNWTGTAPAHPIYGQGLRASCLSSAQVHYRPPDVLEFAGVHIATISSADSQQLPSIFKALAVLRGIGLKKLREIKYPTGGNLFEAYAWTLAYGQIQGRYNPASLSPTFEEREQVIEHVIENADVQEPMKQAHFWFWFRFRSMRAADACSVQELDTQAWRWAKLSRISNPAHAISYIRLVGWSTNAIHV